MDKDQPGCEADGEFIKEMKCSGFVALEELAASDALLESAAALTNV